MQYILCISDSCPIDYKRTDRYLFISWTGSLFAALTSQLAHVRYYNWSVIEANKETIVLAALLNAAKKENG